MMSLVQIILSIHGLVLLVVYVFFRFRRRGRMMAGVPGPRGIPLFGHMLIMCQNPVGMFKSLRKWHKKYGSIYQLSGAHVNTVHIFNPHDIEKVLSSSHNNTKPMPYSFLEGWLREGLLISNGEKWHERRKLLTPAFHFNILNKFFPTFCVHTQDLVDALEKEIDKDKTDLIPLITTTTLRIMCETSMGVEIREEKASTKDYLNAVHKIGRVLVERLCTPWYYVSIVYMFSSMWWREKKILPQLHKFTQEIIQTKREKLDANAFNGDVEVAYGQKSRPAMLDLLLEEEKNGRIDDAGIREEVDTFLFEGHDTTQTALTFMIMRLANEPQIQSSIHKELDSVFGDSRRQPNLEDMNKMKYLECCIKESLRLYPSVPFISRIIGEDVELAGYTIPKTAFCDINIYDIHRNPDVYPEPEKFIPERFLPENTISRHPYAYLPFSAGPRNCIGQKFAMMEIKTLMSGVLRRYRLEPITRPYELEFMADLVLRTTHPIYVRFRLRP